MEKESVPQYLRIAISLGSEIAEGHYPEGTKMPGLSKLASKYSASTETVRRAMQMLADLSILNVEEKKCAVVLSEERAKYYLESLKARRERHELSSKMKSLFKSYQDIGRELEDVSGQLLDALAYPMPSEKMIPTFEVAVKPESDKIGRTIGSLRVWQATGSTIIAVRRGQNIIISPGPYEKLLEDDIIVCVGTPGSEAIVDYYVNAPIDSAVSSEGDYHAIWAGNINESIIEEQETIQANICKCLDCRPEEILDITAMEQGLNNHSFSFICRGEKYIYRHPGEHSGDVVNRQKEAIALKTAKKLGIDDTLLYVDEEHGWKLSKFITVTEEFDFTNKRHAAMLAKHIKALNDSGETLGFNFNYEAESDKLIDIVKEENRSKYRMMLGVKNKLRPAFDILKKNPWPMGMCHNDIYEPNLLIDGDKLYLIDWEFAGDSDIGFDICKVFASAMPKYEDLDEWLSLYYDHKLDKKDKLHLIACAAIVYYYWYIWGLYADENGENVTEYLPLWHDRMNYYLDMMNEHRGK